ncbi:hypothetical protein L228DRAFT_253508 [Xylona heveae TC161]|uniref:von Willebrand and RING finger domain-containing protein n=1 Tax=Xylona heveae (strain CBS 132557 / TC161) TaxID=1328760 RepID=A0A165G1M9_XYLHT|nr:hypothetical protein L228DRAFT_253508 [Xylona heveae TC161]KZF21636.1 hypothetical protein L228DRAFT_253508 [Xylona heveae TC161]
MRRDRTFVGTECAVCEEPLEHILRGEKILQLTCAHVAHEACLYEYIREIDSQSCPSCDAPLGLDTSRGGNVLDIEKLSNIVRSVSQSGPPEQAQTTPDPVCPWDSVSSRSRERPPSVESGARPLPRDSRDNVSRESRERVERFHGGPRYSNHTRHDSGNTGIASTSDYAETHSGTIPRRHDYDVQSMESAVTHRANPVKHPIPPPIVTVRSEFPTISRSREQQSLTCLVTVEVPEGKWRPESEEPRASVAASSLHPSEGYEPSRSSALSRQSDPLSRQSDLISRKSDLMYGPPEALDDVAEDLRIRVDNWHGLDFQRFGKLRRYATIRVGKDGHSWQELECYLFSEMLICIKEKKANPRRDWDEQASVRKAPRCTLKGSILIRKHLKQVDASTDERILTLSLSVPELPSFHLQFQNQVQLEQWKRALIDLNSFEIPIRAPELELDNSGTDEDDYRTLDTTNRVSSVNSSYGAARTNNTSLTEYTYPAANGLDNLPASIHIPVDLVVVIPLTSSMQGLKINVLRDALNFLVQSLGDRDRMGLVSFGSNGGGVPLVGMTTKSWSGWSKVLKSIRAVGQKSLRGDVVEGANAAMDLLMQRRYSNPIASILLISDSSTTDSEGVDFVVSRAEAAKVGIHTFGLGMTHKPDTMIELSSRTKASYSYVKDWMMLRECVAGCLGSLQTTSHQNVRLKLKLPEGSPAKFVKISGALHVTKRATGRDAEVALGDLRFGDKRDVLVQLVIPPDSATQEQYPQDPWESIVSGLEALGGPLDHDDQRTLSVEEVPLIQADMTYGDIVREGTLAHLSRPSLLAITMLPAPAKSRPSNRPLTPPIPPHPSVVQRRMELLTSDMLTRALILVSKGQNDRAQHLLTETRTILKGLGKGGLPPLPPPAQKASTSSLKGGSANDDAASTITGTGPERLHPPSPIPESAFIPGAGIDGKTVAALDSELNAALEWMGHAAIFGRDSRKSVLQSIGVISSQRGYTFRTPCESLWAGRIAGINRLAAKSRQWREVGDESLMEEI